MGNVLLLYLAPFNIGFGNIYLGILGAVLMLSGLFFWGWGYISLGGSFSVLPKAKELVKSGAYSFLNHPIYTGMLLTFIGLSIAKGTLLGLFFSVLVTAPLNYFRAKKEERLLKEKFGSLY
ncbi:isoprenylcysteine carboxylmethyltransferase family protein [Candidatus Gottesmanbacteria bacterium]|nr:isoprenylcysteine carboxylmethyltransferase family protein [Candidatus Gottesmanbacteria bacterium]